MGHNYKVVSLLTLILLGLTATGAYCQETFGRWVFSISDDTSFLYAATTNDSNEMLGEFCYPKKGSCLWMLAISTSCKDGDQYPVLANANSTAAQLTIKCLGPQSNDRYTYAFEDFKLLDGLIKINPRIGFAMPLAGDRFSVVRFSLAGATAAIDQMRGAARKMVGARKAPASNDTRDQII